MANWSKLQEDLVGLPVAKRAKHGIHFQKGANEFVANFSGKPCHYEDGGIWKTIDTTPVLLGDGTFGCAHSPVRIGSDGTVTVGSGYSQRAKLFSAKNIKVDGDHLIREFTNGEQRLYITEDGYRSEITLFKAPTSSQLGKLIASVNGKLPGGYEESPTSMKDADGNSYEYDNAANFRKWLDKAKYPVLIDPDFASGGVDHRIYGQNVDYATARSTSAASSSTTVAVGQRVPSYYNVYRGYVKFDTSSIDDGATITQVNLKLTVAVDVSDADVDIQIAKYNWSAFAASQVAGERETAYDGALAADLDDSIWRNTSGISQNTGYTSGNLATAWVSKTGTTYYALRSKEDSDNSAPTGNEYITLYGGQEATEAYRPVLSVTYTASGIAIPVAQYYYNRLRRN